MRFLRTALASALLGTALGVGVVSAHPDLTPADALAPQAAQTQPNPAPVVTIRSPQWGAGNVTFTGIAVDCSTGQPATRVAVFDGTDPVSAPYIADVSMDRQQPLSAACPGRSGQGRIGYTLIYNTRNLAEGPHTLTFYAEFPNGAVGSTSLFFGVDNNPIYENICSDFDC
jgi:hypothetical protein